VLMYLISNSNIL